MPSRSAPRDCPCHSGLRYAACCGPLHEGAREADTPEALMRSRYAAFARGLGATSSGRSRPITRTAPMTRHSSRGHLASEGHAALPRTDHPRLARRRRPRRGPLSRAHLRARSRPVLHRAVSLPQGASRLALCRPGLWRRVSSEAGDGAAGADYGIVAQRGLPLGQLSGPFTALGDLAGGVVMTVEGE